MHIHTPRLSILARTLLTLGCTATGLVSVAHAEVQGLDLSVPVAQEPIGRGTGMAPNVLFVLDDSSSMTKAFMPDDLNDKIDRYNLPPSISTTQSEQVESVRPLRTYWSRLYYPGGHAYGGRMWYDSSRPLPLNTMRFEPNRTYLRWASGEQRPSPDADLPRVKDSNSYAVQNRDAKVWQTAETCNLVDQYRRCLRYTDTSELVSVKSWIQNHPAQISAGGTAGTLPPLYVLRHNEKNIKARYGGPDDATQVGNYFVINFAVDSNYNYHHTEVFAVDNNDKQNASDRLSQDYGRSKAWPEGQKFVFTDKNGKVLYEGTPRELFDNYFNYVIYHNSRMHVAKGAMIEALAERDEQVRVGLTTINHKIPNSHRDYDGYASVSSSTRLREILYPIPVNQDKGLFKGQNRAKFTEEVFKVSPSGNTPLRYALHAAGQYFSDASSANNPYKDGNKIFSCRQNLAILATDGYYNDFASGFGDVDGTSGDLIRGANGARYQYEPSAPYQDRPGARGYSNTLADIAMYYWKRDLIADNGQEDGKNPGKNNVPVTGRDPAFWQHMRTYGISFGVGGSLDINRPAPGLPGAQQSYWPEPQRDANSTPVPSAADDLWHAAVNSRGSYFTTEDGPSLTAALKNILDEANPGKGPGSANAASSYLFTDAESGNVLQFGARYNASSLSSTLTACTLGSGCMDGPVWDASERLNELLQGNLARERNILVNVSTSGGVDLRSFQWANLSSAQKQVLANGNDELGQDTVRYLRGDTSLDGTIIAHPDSTDSQNAKWRVRAELSNGGAGGGRNVLGMIVHGTPTFIGAPEPIRTELATTLSGYDAFQKANENRPTVLYVAANDGMVHAFVTERKTVAVSAGGAASTHTYEPGDELFAFIPAAAINKNMRDFTRPSFEYLQHYLLDGELNYSEVKIGGQWKTVLVGSMGAAGGADSADPAVFALDVTDPGNPKLLWEKTATAMGQTMGRPVIAPVADGKWSVFIGSGPNQSKTSSQSAILQIDLETGNVTTLQGGGMSATSKGGILGLHVVDSDKDNYADTIYAGDLAGNVWKVANLDGKASGGAQYVKLFTAPQPITAPLTSTVDKNGVRWLFFGTGKALTDADLTDKQTVRTWYGIQDTDAEVKDNELVERHYEVIRNYRRNNASNETTDIVTMNYAVAGDMDGKKGWKIPLNQSGDADSPGYMLLQNRVRSGLLVGQMNFSLDPEPNCDGLNATSRLMVIDPFTGAVSSENDNKTNIDVNDDGVVDEKDMYGGGSGGSGGGTGGGTGGGVPIVGLTFGSGETSGSILIVQEQRLKNGAGSGTGTGGGSGTSQDDIESTRSCALDANGVRVCLPPNPEGKPPSTHSWTELRNTSEAP